MVYIVYYSKKNHDILKYKEEIFLWQKWYKEQLEQNKLLKKKILK